MKENFYLNKELKNYYNSDFEKLLSYNELKFWDIDDGLQNILIQINRNPKIQTLYSKKYDFSNDSFAAIRNSYLELAFTEDIKANLFSSLENLKLLFQNEDVEFTLSLIPPKNNGNCRGEETKPLGCLNNPDYFRIYHYRIEIISDMPKDHILFWESLASTLTALL